MTFHQYSKEIITEYLGTVAYVDDLIFSKKVESKEVDLKIVSTREMAAKTDKEMPLVNKDVEEEVVESKPDSPIVQLVPNINPATFTNAFLAKGIHCSLFEVENDEDSLEPLKSILKKSDVVILDWQMHHDDGRKARELLLSVILSSQQPELRLYIIFTNDKKQYNNLLSQTILPELMKAGVINEIPEDIECVFKFGHSKIVVLEKENGEKSETTVSDEELPDRIIEEFAEITSGLVSNTVLKAISVIRRNSHSLLATFNKNLDPPYLAHRAMSPYPEDAELLLKEIIIDSIDSIISYSNVVSTCSIERIEDWIKSSSFSERELNLATGTAKPILINISKEALTSWQKMGYIDFFIEEVRKQIGRHLLDGEFRSFERMKLKNKASEFFLPEELKLEGQNEDFAVLTHHKSNFKTPSYIPYLTLGVVVKKENDYLLCIQQRCDSIRLEQGEIRKFLFLPLTDEGSFPIVFKNETGEYALKKFDLRNCHKLQIEKFRQLNHGIVEAIQVDGAFYFKDIEGAEYKWILDLKESHAQRISNKYAAELSRVGLDESEWLRRS